MKHQIATKAIAASSRRRLAGFISASAVFVVTVAATMACATNASAAYFCNFYPALEKRWIWNNWSITYSTVVHNQCDYKGGTVRVVTVDDHYRQIGYPRYIYLAGDARVVLGPASFIYELEW